MRTPKFDVLIVSCEHGGNKVPRAYAKHFAKAQGLLKTHRGYDKGALPIAKAVAKDFRAPLVAATVSRLVVDLNRSLYHDEVLSKFIKTALAPPARQRLIDKHYLPYRQKLEQLIAQCAEGQKRVLHLSVHSFCPIRRGVRRLTDIGLLYDPRRRLERDLAHAWQRGLQTAQTTTHWRVRRNYPYVGYSDGLTTYLRQKFSAQSYAGIELEINQKWLPKHGASIAALVGRSLAAYLTSRLND